MMLENAEVSIENRIQSLYSGLLLMEWAQLQKRTPTPAELLLTARGHCQLWMQQGVECQNFNIVRSKELFQIALAHPDNSDDAHIWLEFCRVLQLMNLNDLALTIMQKIMPSLEEHPDYANYLLAYGCLLKALQKYDEAAGLFFKATQLGPPKLTTKLDMMFIISRNIEESSGTHDEAHDEAYRMVHTHLVAQNEISETLSFEDWLHNANTWMNLG
jgi:tetratricopeptide (TPR) repeat protein